MNIIYGQELADSLKNNYIVLELDTITIKSSDPVKVFCVIENMPLEELSKADRYSRLHNDLLHQYRARNWEFVIQAANTLKGAWGKEVDSFYEEIISRVTKFKEHEPDESWTGIIAK